MEVNSTVVLATAIAVIVALGGSWWRGIKKILADTFALTANHDVTTQTVDGILRDALGQTALILLPLFGAVVAAGLLANIIQNLPNFSAKALMPDAQRINPKGGLKRVFGTQGLLELVKSIAKIAIVAGAAAIVIWPALGSLRLLLFTDPTQVANVTVTLVRNVSYAIIAVLVPLAIGDFILQRIIFERSLRMSKQEVKEEGRQADIAPEIKAAIRRRAAAIARSRMLGSVPDATVIITNPTHYAVALRYESDWNAPKVVAKGADLIAQKIREIAVENDVMIIENPPLARGLYASVELDQEIRPEFFHAVVEVLTFVHRAAQRRYSWS